MIDTKGRRAFLKKALSAPVVGGAIATGGIAATASAGSLVTPQATSSLFHPNNQSITLTPPPSKTLATPMIQQAIDKLSATGGGTLIISAGKYITGTVFLKSNVHIYLAHGAHWKGSENIEDYTELSWGHNKDRHPWHLIYADNVNNVVISGTGTIDGNGEAFWQHYKKNADGSFKEPQWINAKDKKISPLIDINRSRNIFICDTTIHTGGGWCIHCFDCDNVKIQGVRIDNNIYSPNSDGIDLTGCRDVSISDCYIKTCDDAIVLKTLADSRTCERVAVNNCVIETLCVGIKMGAGESFKDMRDFSATNCVFNGTSRFFALYSKRGGMLENISISNITGNTNAKLVFNRPIQLMVERDHEGVIGGIRNVVVSNMQCHTDGRIMMTCDNGGVLDNITFRDVSVSYPWVEDPAAINEGARSNQFPRQKDHRDANAARAAIVIKNATRVNLQNLVINWPTGEVPKDWQHPERIENGTRRVHRYSYDKALPANFYFCWASNVENLTITSPFAASSSEKLDNIKMHNTTLL